MLPILDNSPSMAEFFTYAWMGGFSVTLIVAAAIVLTERFHGTFTYDSTHGLQKFHTEPTPRIGGVALLFGFAATLFFIDVEVRTIWLTIGLAGMPAFLFGLLEDLTKRISVRIRFGATLLSGLVFALASGYTISHVDLWGVDMLLAVGVFSIAFTAFAIGGITNAINIIDGFHGLAAGTVIIILAAFAVVSWRVGDTVLMEVSLLMLAITVGFLPINFPLGRLFLGDSGAYFLGFFIAALAVMLPARNPEVSPWISLLILGYPMTETIVSIVRKTRRRGHHPGSADRVHLHMLVYRSFGRGLSNKLRFPRFRSPLTGALMWGFSFVILLFVSVIPYTTLAGMLALIVTVLLYLFVYRHVALLQKRL